MTARPAPRARRLAATLTALLTAGLARLARRVLVDATPTPSRPPTASDDAAAPLAEAGELRLGYFANLTHALPAHRRRRRHVPEDARRHEADDPDLQRRPGGRRGPVRRRDRRRLRRPEPGHQRVRASPTARRSGSSPARPRAAPSSSSTTRSRPRPTSRARRWPRRSSATPRTSPCAPGSTDQKLTSSLTGGASDVNIAAAGERADARRLQGRPGRRRLAARAVGVRGWSTRARTCSSTRRTCGRTATS